MFIGSSFQNYTHVNRVQASNQLPAENPNLKQQEEQSVALGTKTYDFTNMSRREYETLWQSGVLGEDLPPLILPKSGIDLTGAHGGVQQQMDAVYDEKINYVDFLEGRITYNKSENLPTEYVEQALETLLAFQGKNLQPTIYAQA